MRKFFAQLRDAVFGVPVLILARFDGELPEYPFGYGASRFFLRKWVRRFPVNFRTNALRRKHLTQDLEVRQTSYKRYREVADKLAADIRYLEQALRIVSI